MNCHDVRRLAPLFLSGEMSVADVGSYGEHLAECGECSRELEEQRALDARLAGAFATAEMPDASAVEQRVRRQIRQPRRRWLTAVAAAMVAMMAASYGVWRLSAPPKVFADAARDHRIEVVEKQSRKWRMAVAEIDAVTRENGLTFTQASALAPTGCSLDRAKICRLDGQRTLHLVFRNAVREFSVYVRPRAGNAVEMRTVARDSERISGIETTRFQVLVVSAGSADECEELARWTASRL